MNRLIIIGNGFDLAHGLKSSYADFVTNYISNSINKFYENNNYTDPLIELRMKYAGYSFKDKYTLTTPKGALATFGNLRHHDHLSISVKSNFFETTLDKIEKLNWVDFEVEYFNNLLKCNPPFGEGFDFQRVKKLNLEFDFLKKELENYLLDHQKSSGFKFIPDYVDIFCEPIIGTDIVRINIHDHLPGSLLFLNFNYTNTLEEYKLRCSTKIHTSINYIHGQLGSTDNPIIFGFGDEYDKKYLEFEDMRNKELLKHIKSFEYFKTSNYHNLIRFINSNDYQIYILGHSLGVSDRTMLKKILEHERCKSVKIFYHSMDNNIDDYTDKTYDISSHFSNKEIMREKIVPHNLSKAMPQFSD